jgi:hypothetical protein
MPADDGAVRAECGVGASLACCVMLLCVDHNVLTYNLTCVDPVVTCVLTPG